MLQMNKNGQTSMHILLRGKPGIGKTTIIKKLCEKLPRESAQGFFTIEIRDKSERIGFDVVTLNGKRGILARKNQASQYMVGKYGIDLISFERIALPELQIHEQTKLIIIDEIGKMECCSRNFIQQVQLLFDSRIPIIATIPIYDIPFVRILLKNHSCQIIEITTSNRDHLPFELALHQKSDPKYD